MSEEQAKPKSLWWLIGPSIGGIILCLLLAGWIWLPEIAILGLGHELTDEIAREALYWAGPRSFGPLIRISP